jgi:hypothetical protein
MRRRQIGSEEPSRRDREMRRGGEYPTWETRGKQRDLKT